MPANSESNKRSAQTKREKYGPDYHKKAASKAGKASKRGYFAVLKETNPFMLAHISRMAAKASVEARAKKKQLREDKDLV